MTHNTRSYSYCVFRLLCVGSIIARDEKCSGLNKVSKNSLLHIRLFLVGDHLIRREVGWDSVVNYIHVTFAELQVEAVTIPCQYHCGEQP
jgi:hypothetical protein